MQRRSLQCLLRRALGVFPVGPNATVHRRHTPCEGFGPCHGRLHTLHNDLRVSKRVFTVAQSHGAHSVGY